MLSLDSSRAAGLEWTRGVGRDGAPWQNKSMKLSSEEREFMELDIYITLVELVVDQLPDATVLRWDKDVLHHTLLRVSKDPQRYLCRLQEDDEKGPRECVLPMYIAKLCLALDDQLANLRYRLVPGRITEEHFWKKYWELLGPSIREHVLMVTRNARNDDVMPA